MSHSPFMILVIQIRKKGLVEGHNIGEKI